VRTAALPIAASADRDRVLDQLADLYGLRYPDFLRTAAAISGSAESGREAVHDAFVSLVRGRNGYRGRGTIEAWAWRAVVNAAKKQHRARNIVAIGEIVQSAADDRSSFEGDDIRIAIAGLPDRQRMILFLRYYADLDYTAIAAACGIRVGTVGATLHAAQETLRNVLEES
jgi:RNA polymerase sigma factor (sigma-70 family)